MGLSGSKKPPCITYDEAVNKLTPSQQKQINELFKRLTDGSSTLKKEQFVQNVIGRATPHSLAERLYTVCGGGAKGITLPDLVCALVLFTTGNFDLKIRFLWNIYSNENGTKITLDDFERLQEAECGWNVDKKRSAVVIMFDNASCQSIDFAQFEQVLKSYRQLTPLSSWLLAGIGPPIALAMASPCKGSSDLTSFLQTLAGVTHLTESEIIELEKYFQILNNCSSNNYLIDRDFFESHLSPPVPLRLIDGIFNAFDENQDGHIDLKELCCGVSSACRGPIGERLKFCFKVFDRDQDGLLDRSELETMLECLTMLQSLATRETAKLADEMATMQSDGAIQVYDLTSMSFDEYLVWAHQELAIMHCLTELLFEIGHVGLGLRAQCHHDERRIVEQWLERERSRGFVRHQFWYIVDAKWWRAWQRYTQSSSRSSSLSLSGYAIDSICDECHVGGGGVGGGGSGTMRFRHKSISVQTIEEGVICDENMTSMGSISTTATTTDNSSVRSSSSSSGISTASGSQMKQQQRQMAMVPAPPGQIDNTALVVHYGDEVRSLTGEVAFLRPDRALVLHEDYVLVPKALWMALAHWYGATFALPRQVIYVKNRGLEIELNPLRLRIYQHQNVSLLQNSNWKHMIGNYGALTTPNYTSCASLGKAKRVLKYAATFSRLATVRQVLEYLCKTLGLRTEDTRLWLVRNDDILLDSEESTLEELQVRNNDSILLEVRNRDSSWPEELGALSNNSLRERKTSSMGMTVGVVGLLNLGNTCFMNAALQALSNTRPLTLYFQRDKLNELNRNNPNGTKGQVAQKYAALCRRIWTKDAAHTFAPLDLKSALSKYAPHLTSGGQHDSQEFMAFLLDALHEDLNRVTKKEYIELPDSQGRADAVVALEAWQNHLKRDHSIITDLFHGQLKSKVTCKTCGHESVRFDPFNLLSIPLPMENFVLFEIIVIRCDDSVPKKYAIRQNSEKALKVLKRELAQLCGIEPMNLLLCDMRNGFIYRMFSDSDRFSNCDSMKMYAYELTEGGAKTNSSSSSGSNEEIDGAETIEQQTNSPTSRFRGSDGDGDVAMNSSAAEKFCQEQNSPSKVSLIDDESAQTRPRPDTVDATLQTERDACTDPITTNNDRPQINYYFIVAVHRRNVRPETFFLSHQTTKTHVFGVPLVISYNSKSTCRDLYEKIWVQVNRLLTPLPKTVSSNHATDCDDSLRYKYPFVLKLVAGTNAQICARCPWTEYCNGCTIDLSDSTFEHALEPFAIRGRGRDDDIAAADTEPLTGLAIDWDETAYYLRYQSNREGCYDEDESVKRLRQTHHNPINLDYCLQAFTSEESLETKYKCAGCDSLESATKKLQIWRLPPLLIIHLKRFDFVKKRLAKTHRYVQFPFRNFNPTDYLASVPKETISRHLELRAKSKTSDSQSITSKRERVSTSLIQTPISDENLEDFHQHHLKDPSLYLDLNYHLYALITHSGMLNGGHYVSYACNPNGKWYMYNDSTCREVSIEAKAHDLMNSAYILFYERTGLDYNPYISNCASDAVEPGSSGPIANTAAKTTTTAKRKDCHLS